MGLFCFKTCVKLHYGYILYSKIYIYSNKSLFYPLFISGFMQRNIFLLISSLFIISSGNFSFGQQSPVDSLENVLEKSDVDGVKTKIIKNIMLSPKTIKQLRNMLWNSKNWQQSPAPMIYSVKHFII